MPEPTTWKVRRNGRDEYVTDEAVTDAMPMWELSCRTAAAERPPSAIDSSVVARLLDEHDKATAAAAETRQWLAESDKVWARRGLAVWEAKDRELTAAVSRAAAAEAAVQRAEVLADNWTARAANRFDPNVLRGLADELRTTLNPGPAGLSGVNPAGKDGHDAPASVTAEPALPADPTPRVMPPEIPLSAVAALDDGQSATVTATISAVNHRRNTAGAEYGFIVLADGDTDTAWPVRVSPAGWLKYRHHLTVGAKVTALVAACRDDDTGLQLWLTAAATLDWDTIPAADLTADGAQ